MALYENGQLTKPIGSAVQMETLPEPEPKLFGETDGDYATRVLAPWGARTRTITFQLPLSNEALSPLTVKETTVALAYSATAADIQAALEALASIAPGDIDVQGSGRKFTYAFGGAYANRRVELMFSTHAAIGKRFFESIVEGVSVAGQAAVREEYTNSRLGVTDADFTNATQEPAYDIGDPRRYNEDGTIKDSQRTDTIGTGDGTTTYRRR
jgi:hypothetical protein